MRAQHLSVASAICTFAFTGWISAAITLNAGGVTVLNAAARDTSISFTPAQSDRNPGGLPYADTHLVTQGASSSDNIYGLSSSAFNIQMTHARAGLLDSAAVTQGSIFFSPSSDTPYAVTGQYTAANPDGRTVVLLAKLTDLDTTAVIFNNSQVSAATANENFTIGGSGGDQTNDLTGSATGTLLAGHSYKFEYQGQIYAGSAGAAATAAGNINLALPEPGSSVILALGSLITLARRRH